MRSSEYAPCCNATRPTALYTLSLHDALPIYPRRDGDAACHLPPLGADAGPAGAGDARGRADAPPLHAARRDSGRSEEHTSELQSHVNLVCRLLLEKKKSVCMRKTVIAVPTCT